MGNRTARRGLSRSAAIAALAATVAALAGCGGQSEQDRVSQVARAYADAYVAGDGVTLCALMTASLRRELTTIAHEDKPSGCAQVVAFSAGAVRDVSAIHPFVSAVRVSGSRARATIRTGAGVGVLPLAREASRWRVSGPVHYTARVWREADYRVREAAGISPSSLAGILVRRAEAIIGTRAEARAIGPDEVRLAVAQPARLTDLKLVTARGAGRFGLYDWEADALTPAGRQVADQLRHRDGSALLISQGSETDGPGAAGGMTEGHALEVASAGSLADYAARSRAKRTALPPNLIVVQGKAPSAAAVAGGLDPDARYFVLKDLPAVTRADITHAYANVDPRGDPDINLGFTPRGASAFRRLTAAIARRGAGLSTPQLAFNQHIAVVLDGRLLSVDHVDFHVYPFGIPTAHGVDITGGFSPTTAQQLAAEITAPPQPAALQLIHSATFTRRGD